MFSGHLGWNEKKLKADHRLRRCFALKMPQDDDLLTFTPSGFTYRLDSTQRSLYESESHPLRRLPKLGTPA